MSAGKAILPPATNHILKQSKLKKMQNNFEIIDNNGVIHSGHEFEMKKAFDFMTEPEIFLMDNYGMNKKGVKQLIEKWKTEWAGDLKLIEVHSITR